MGEYVDVEKEATTLTPFQKRAVRLFSIAYFYV